MSSSETYTADEIMEIFQELDVDVFYRPQAENEFGVATIDCEIGPINFGCSLFLDEPFFEHLALMAFRFNIEDCLIFANKYNENLRISHVVVDLDDAGNVIFDEDEESTVHAHFNLSFAGGVTREHLKYLFEMWIEEMIDFYEIEFEEDSVEVVEGEKVDVPQGPEFLELPLVERISVYLSLNSDKTARTISKVLDLDRQEINRVLYKHRDRFQKTRSHPPHWNLKERI